MLVIQLTTEQIEALSGAREQIDKMAHEGKPGALFGQIYGDHMRVGIMSNDAMRKLYDALGTPKEKRTAHRSAYEISRGL